MILARENTENGEVILREGAAGYEIIVDGQFLMSSASGNSSVALVEIGLSRLTLRDCLQLLIGGMGLGFSLQTALSNRAVTEVTVVELEAEIIQWHRRGLIGNTSQLVTDPRIKIVNRDLLGFIDDCRQKYDLIALDIDNGPDWLCHEGNARLYGENYLQRLREMLKLQGILTMWSAAPSLQLKRHLHQVFGNVEEVEAMDHNGEGKLITAYIDVCENNI